MSAIFPGSASSDADHQDRLRRVGIGFDTDIGEADLCACGDPVERG